MRKNEREQTEQPKLGLTNQIYTFEKSYLHCVSVVLGDQSLHSVHFLSDETILINLTNNEKQADLYRNLKK